MCWFIYLVVIVALLIVLILNSMYKKTYHYQNSFLVGKDYQNIDEMIDFVNLGSTYAQFAFGTYESLHIRGGNLALPSQSLSADKFTVKQVIKNMHKNSVMIIPIAPCLMLYDENKNVFRIMRLKKNSLYRKLKTKFPVLVNPKTIIRIIRDNRILFSDIFDTEDVYVSKDVSEYKLKNLANVWIKLFKLKDLKDSYFSSHNISIIENNTRVLVDIVNLCKANDVIPIVVTTPFSERLHSLFSDAFRHKAMYEPIDRVVETTGVHFLDYQMDERFYHRCELYIDGGFCLNKRGSKLFMQILSDDIKAIIGK